MYEMAAAKKNRMARLSDLLFKRVEKTSFRKENTRIYNQEISNKEYAAVKNKRKREKDEEIETKTARLGEYKNICAANVLDDIKI